MEKKHKLIASDVLFELASLTRHSFNYQQVTKLIMDKLSQVIDYTVGTLFLIEEGEMVVNVKHNSTRAFLTHTRKETINKINEYTQKKCELSKTKSIIYEAPEALTEDLVSGNRIGSIIASPLIIREEIHGIMLIAHYNKQQYSQEDQSLLNVFANHASIIIDNVLLYAHAEQRMLELSVLHEVGKALSSILNLEELLEKIAVNSSELVKAERVSLMFLNEKKQVLYIKTAVGLSKEIIDTTEQPVGEGIAGIVARKAQILTIPDIEQERSLQKLKNGAMYRSSSFVSLPIIIRRKVVGVLNVSEKTTGTNFTAEDAELLDTFLNQATTAIENAILYHNMEQLAVTDGLTMVYNHRYFQERLEKEVRRAERYSLSLTLMMLDVDYFKKYNDTYGHPKGDVVLKEITDILRENVRDFDVIARYGGEEFAVILPNTGKKAQDVAERMRMAVAATDFPVNKDGKVERKTISIGVATYPTDAEDDLQLIDRADEALYIAKESGRNLVIVYQSQGKDDNVSLTK